MFSLGAAGTVNITGTDNSGLDNNTGGRRASTATQAKIKIAMCRTMVVAQGRMGAFSLALDMFGHGHTRSSGEAVGQDGAKMRDNAWGMS
jgi:hypothetical protein